MGSGEDVTIKEYQEGNLCNDGIILYLTEMLTTAVYTWDKVELNNMHISYQCQISECDIVL